MTAASWERRVILARTPRGRGQEGPYRPILDCRPRALSAAATAEALELDIGRWASAFGEGGPARS